VTGLAIGGVLAAPLLLLGGRSGAEADSSTSERLDCWAEALSMWREHPILGVGLGQFNEYHYKTAHNSYLLTLAELGLPGMVLFSIIVYLSAKIPFVVLSRVGVSDEAARPARAWAMALLAAFAGLSVGIFFLSFAYHYVLWIYIGLAGALYSAVRRHDPSIRVTLGIRDFAFVAATNLLMIASIYLYTRWALA
jgi:O-antigen ligase